jgi:hypothetical protein
MNRYRSSATHLLIISDLQNAITLVGACNGIVALTARGGINDL